jgi:hypothetical protein
MCKSLVNGKAIVMGLETDIIVLAEAISNLTDRPTVLPRPSCCDFLALQEMPQQWIEMETTFPPSFFLTSWSWIFCQLT